MNSTKVSRSRSRSRSKGRRDRDRSRSRGRDRRDRSRSRGRRNRDRSRSRSRGRRDRSRSEGRRDRDRSRSRGRSRRDRSRSRDRSRRDHDSRSQSRGSRHARSESRERGSEGRERLHPGDRTTPLSGARETSEMVFTAAMVADRFVEVYAGASIMRRDQLHECVSPDATVVSLGNGGKQLASSETVAIHLATSSSLPSAAAKKRLYLESNRPQDPTFAVDFYAPGASPGWDPTIGVSPEAVLTTGTVVAYRVERNQIQLIAVAADNDGLAQKMDVSEAEIFASPVFIEVLDLAIRPGSLGGSTITKVYHDCMCYSIPTAGPTPILDILVELAAHCLTLHPCM